MRILLTIHPEFLAFPSPDDRGRISGWIDRYEAALQKRGHVTARFNPREHRLKDFDVVHFFSKKDGESWKVIRDAGGRVLVTPALPGTPVPHASGLRARVGELPLRFGLALWQRRWPPIGARTFLASADHYLAPSDWTSFLESEWKVVSARTELLPRDPDQAALAFERAAERTRG